MAYIFMDIPINKDRKISLPIFWKIFSFIFILFAFLLTLLNAISADAKTLTGSQNLNMPIGYESCYIDFDDGKPTGTLEIDDQVSGSGLPNTFSLSNCPNAQDPGGIYIGGWYAEFYYETAGGIATGTIGIGGSFALDTTTSPTSGSGYINITEEGSSTWIVTKNGPLHELYNYLNPTDFPSDSESRTCIVVADTGNKGSNLSSLNGWITNNTSTPTIPVVWNCWDRWQWGGYSPDYIQYGNVNNGGSYNPDIQFLLQYNVSSTTSIPPTWARTICYTESIPTGEFATTTSPTSVDVVTVLNSGLLTDGIYLPKIHLDEWPKWGCSTIIGNQNNILGWTPLYDFSTLGRGYLLYDSGTPSSSRPYSIQSWELIENNFDLIGSAFPLNFVLAPAQMLTNWSSTSIPDVTLNGTMGPDAPVLIFNLSDWMDEGSQSVSSWAAESKSISRYILWVVFVAFLFRLITWL